MCGSLQAVVKANSWSNRNSQILTTSQAWTSKQNLMRFQVN